MQSALPSMINTSETSVKVADVKTLICLLQTPDPNVIVTALDALLRFADTGVKSKSVMLSLGVIKIVMDLMGSADKKIKKAAVACIASCTADLNESIPEIEKLMEITVSILKTEEQVDVLDEAALILANTSRDFSQKAKIKKLGGIAALIRCMEMNDPDVRLNSAIALSNLLDDFACRPEIRKNNGLKPILELLSSEHPEVLENALKCLSKATEDAGNRGEFKRVDIIKRLVDFVSIDRNDAFFTQSLTILMLYLDDVESIYRFAEVNGVASLTKLSSHYDNQVKKRACTVLAKALKFDKIQVMAKEAGLVNILSTQLLSFEPAVSASCAIAISALSRNDSNLQELLRLGTLEGLIKLLQGDDKEAKREAIWALSSFAGNFKVKAKFQNTPEYLNLVAKVLQSDDTNIIVNTCYCVVALCEEGILCVTVAAIKAEFLKAGVLNTVFTILDSLDVRVQAAGCLSLSRFLLDDEAQTILSKNPKIIGRLVQLLNSPDISVSRNAAYTISIASRLDVNASIACSSGAIDALVQLSKETSKKSQKFASEALDKILNFNLSAKYWLVNHLNASNIITDGFYDMGFAGCNLDKLGDFPTLQHLSSEPINAKREVLLVDSAKDPLLIQLTSFFSETISGKTPETQIKIIALAVSTAMGGSVSKAELSSFSYKFQISELKLKSNSNVILLGQLSNGTFYHRALLFKTLCDRLGFKSCMLVRGEYHRAWNIVDVKNVVFEPTIIPIKKPSSGKKKASIPELDINSAQQRSNYLGTAETVNAGTYDFDEAAIVDLIFEPGKLLPITSREALEYQRKYLQ